MKQQTAVEQLEKKLKTYLSWSSFLEEDFEKAKQMEKEQITKAWDDGDYAYFYSKETGRDFDNGEQYYNEKFNLGTEETEHK